MAFRRPLNAFLSYSHADTVLFNAFKKHLKSLADDGLITFWHDQMITGGREWDDEIGRKLESAQLFIALTSENFNDSGYIEDVEMRRALERHAAGECRIIPIMGTPWYPPQSLRKYELLPSMDKPIGSPDNGAAFTAVIRGIKDAIEEMETGRWPGLTGNRTAARAGPEPSHDFPYLCDWTDPIESVRLAFSPDRGSQRSPCVLILRATEQDGPEAFLRRIQRDDLAKFFGHAVRDPVPMQWPRGTSVDDRVCTVLGNSHKRFRRTQLPEGLTILETSAELSSSLEDYIGYWKDWSPLPTGKGLLTCVKLIYPNRELLESTSVKYAVPEGVRAVTVDLPEVRREDAVLWAGKIIGQDRKEREQELSNDIRGLFPGGRPLPMDTLAPKLRDVLARHR